MALRIAGLVVIVLAMASLLLLVFAVWVAARRRDSRYKAMLALCAVNGLVPGPIQVSTDFVLTASGKRRGFEGQFSNAADFWFREDKSTEYFTIMTATFPGIRTPHVVVSRKNASGDELWGLNKVELESIDFTNEFSIRAEDPRSAVMLLDPEMMQWLMDCADVSFELSGEKMLAYVYRPDDSGDWQPSLAALRAPRHVDPTELELLLKFVAGFGQRIPPLLRTDFAAPATGQVVEE
jgi:hypothetical protein